MYAGKLCLSLLVADVERSVDYYQRVLAFAFRGYWDAERQRETDAWTGEAPPGSAELAAGENRITLRRSEDPLPAAAARFVLEVVDLDVIRRRVEGSGARTSRVALDDRGRRSFRVIDEDGYVWELVRADR